MHVCIYAYIYSQRIIHISTFVLVYNNSLNIDITSVFLLIVLLFLNGKNVAHFFGFVLIV